MAGFEHPISGNINIDGDRIRDLDKKWLRSQMAFILKEPVLFSVSIKYLFIFVLNILIFKWLKIQPFNRENIRLGRLSATDAEIEQAAKKANVHEFIMSTPLKYATQVGENGFQLSAAQKRQIEMARVLIRNPKILIIDETDENEPNLREALERANSSIQIGRTTIIITNHPNAIRNADLIVCISQGEVKETGTHDQLMSINGLYSDFVNFNNQINSELESDDHRNTKVNENNFSSQKSNQKTTIEPKDEKYKLFKYERKLGKYHIPEFFLMSIVMFLQLLNGFLPTANALVFGEIMTLFMSSNLTKRSQMSSIYVAIMIGLSTLNFISHVVYTYGFSLCESRFTIRLKVKMFESMLRQEMTFHDKQQNKPNILTSQLSSQTVACKGLTSEKITLMMQGFSGIVLPILISFILNVKLSLLLLIFLPLGFLTGAFASRIKGPNYDEACRMSTETVKHITTVLSWSQADYFHQKFKQLNKLKYPKFARIIAIQALLYSISSSLLFFIQPSALSLGYYLVKYENFHIPQLPRIYAIITLSIFYLVRVYTQLPDRKKSLQGARAVFGIVDRVSKIDSLSEEGLKPNSIKGNIRFSKVDFRHPEKTNVKIFDHLDLSINHGETHALVGPNGKD